MFSKSNVCLEIDCKELIPPAYVAWRPGTITQRGEEQHSLAGGDGGGAQIRTTGKKAGHSLYSVGKVDWIGSIAVSVTLTCVYTYLVL